MGNGAMSDTPPTGPPARSTHRLPGPSQTGASIHLGWFSRTKIISMKILKLTFKTDHHVITDNNSDWQNTGTVFPKPDWTYGKSSNPISHTKNQAVTVEVEFEVNPGNADATDADVTGTAAFGSLVFNGSTPKPQFKGGTMTITATSTGPLPDTVDKLTGDIKWSVSTKEDGPFDAGSSFGHVVYVTMDTPVAVSGSEGGFTLKRMDKSVELVKGTGKAVPPWNAAPLAIVDTLMPLIKNYTLIPDPAVNGARPGVNHPQYFNNIGGAWNVADFIANSAECQAIVRFFRAVIKQVGCPGTAQIMLVYADPNVNNGNTVLEDDFESSGDKALHHVANRMINGQASFAALLDTNPGPSAGKVFDGNNKGRLPPAGANAFEACMKFTDPGGTTEYFAGGTGGAKFTNKDDVINVFQALVWLSNPTGGQPGENLMKVEQIVKKYH
jgi:hypothetical protein